MTPEDLAILDRIPITAAGNYLVGDVRAALVMRTRERNRRAEHSAPPAQYFETPSFIAVIREEVWRGACRERAQAPREASR
jgi:hypothetical protein